MKAANQKYKINCLSVMPFTGALLSMSHHFQLSSSKVEHPDLANELVAESEFSAFILTVPKCNSQNPPPRIHCLPGYSDSPAKGSIRGSISSVL